MNKKHSSAKINTHTKTIIEEQGIPIRERIVSLIKSLGEWRDRGLVIVGILYTAGYLMWSWNALENNLGLLPALQFQYVVAGIGPTLIGIILISGGLSVWRFLVNVWLKNLDTNPNSPWPLIRSGFVVGSLIALGGLIYSFISPSLTMIYAIGAVLYGLFIEKEKSWLRSWLSKWLVIIPYDELSNDKQVKRGLWAFVLFIATALVWLNYKTIDSVIFSGILKILPQDKATLWTSYLLVIVVIFGGSTIIPEWLAKFYRIFYLLLILGGLAVIGLLYYKGIYIQLPQEFGGVKPRCAYLDIKIENLSEETRAALFITSQLDQNTPIQQSAKLDVLFTSNNLLMVRANPPSLGKENVVYEIPRANVQAITWCR